MRLYHIDHGQDFIGEIIFGLVGPLKKRVHFLFGLDCSHEEVLSLPSFGADQLDGQLSFSTS